MSDDFITTHLKRKGNPCHGSMTEILGPRKFEQLPWLASRWPVLKRHAVHPHGEVASPADNSKQCCLLWQPHIFIIFHNYGGLQSSVLDFVYTILKEWFAASIRNIPERWQKYTDLSGKYVECVEV
jgi:hypothetical protein